MAETEELILTPLEPVDLKQVTEKPEQVTISTIPQGAGSNLDSDTVRGKVPLSADEVGDVSIARNITVTGKVTGDAPSCRAYNSAVIATTSGTWATVTLDTERWDNDSIHSTSSNTSRLTCVTAGVYQISGNLGFTAGMGNGQHGIRIRLNGSTVIGQHSFNFAAGDVYLSVSTQYSLAVGDYVELQGLQTSGIGQNILSTANYSPEFMMTYLGDQ